MRYVILRDDDTNALTPIDCLERLYRPFLDRGLPVNLAVIPDVATNATTPEGKPEGFLTAGCHGEPRTIEAMAISPSPPRSGEECPSPAGAGDSSSSETARGVWRSQKPEGPSERVRASQRGRRPDEGGWAETARCGRGAVVHLKSSTLDFGNSAQAPSLSDVSQQETVPISANLDLIQYLRENRGYKIVQHGCHHDYFEFDRHSPAEINARLDRGRRLFADAGFREPQTFVAPHDKFSRAAYREVRKRFSVISSGWFERRRLPMPWWPNYVRKKIRRAPHWRVGDTTLLSHPGCFLSWRRPYATMVDEIIRDLQCRRLTVLVTHWWEYFRDRQPDEPFIGCLHELADYLTTQSDIRVVSFSDVAEGRVPLS